MADGTRTTHWFIVKARVAIKSRRFMQSIGGLFSAVKPNRNCSRLRRRTLLPASRDASEQMEADSRAWAPAPHLHLDARKTTAVTYCRYPTRTAPPFTLKISPVMKLAYSVQRNSTGAAISSGVPT